MQKKYLRDRLTPYNWLYVQKVTVDGKTVYAPAALHADRDEPTCAYLCPFGAIAKNGDGSVVIDPDGCFGGAKCRDVCPWGVPMRQAGVGLYLKLAPKLGGGGVMCISAICVMTWCSRENLRPVSMPVRRGRCRLATGLR